MKVDRELCVSIYQSYVNKELERTDKNVPASIVLDQAILKLATRTARVTVWCLSATVCPVLYSTVL